LTKAQLNRLLTLFDDVKSRRKPTEHDQHDDKTQAGCTHLGRTPAASPASAAASTENAAEFLLQVTDDLI
jgi:hypothetical protein